MTASLNCAGIGGGGDVDQAVLSLQVGYGEAPESAGGGGGYAPYAEPG